MASMVADIPERGGFICKFLLLSSVSQCFSMCLVFRNNNLKQCFSMCLVFRNNNLKQARYLSKIFE